MKQKVLELVKGIVKCGMHMECSLLKRDQDTLFSYLNSLYYGFYTLDVHDQVPMLKYFEAMSPQTVYGISDRFRLYYTAILIPEDGTVLLLGPCLLEAPDDAFISEVLRRNGISLKSADAFRNFYRKWPIWDQAALHTMGRVIGKYLYGNDPLDHRYFHAWDYPLVNLNYTDDSSRMLEMKSVEQMYERENALLDAVSRGERQEAFNCFTDRILVLQMRQYTSDPLRSAKNACIAFHAKICKAAERGGVHPIHLENAASQFHQQIEFAVSTQEVISAAQNILRRYIQLVRKTAVPQCSGPVSQAVKLVQLGLNSPLSVNHLAELIGVHPNYLSRIFKHEMGIALTEYINKQRIMRAVPYLNETSLPVRDIALYAGFEDINYFSRVFKRYIGCSPSQFRRNAQVKQKTERKETEKENFRQMSLKGEELNQQIP